MTRALAELPGPKGLPLIGNLHQVDSARIHLTLEAWSERYGPFYRFNLGRGDVLAVGDAGAIAAVLRDRPAGFRRTRLLERVFAELGVGGLFAANGDAWRAQRTMVMAAFDARHLKTFFPFLAGVTARLHRRWCRHADQGTAFDLQADLMRYTVDVVAGLAFGVDINTLETDGETLQSHLNPVFPMLNRRLMMPFPYWRWVRLPVDRALDRHLATLRAAVADLIAQARARLEARPELREAPSNLLDAMVAARESPQAGLTDDDVASNVVTLLLAGEDTTANTLAWLICLASGDPGVMRRLGLEARAVLGEAPVATRLEDTAQLAFTRAVTHETMRLKPVAPVMFLEAVRPTVVGDVALPGGAVVGLLMRQGALDSRHFAAPLRFAPERRLGGTEDAVAPPPRERISMPFGAGPRICPGRNLALLEIALVTSMLFRSFDIARLETADGGAPQEWLSFTMAPSKLRVTLARRAETS